MAISFREGHLMDQKQVKVWKEQREGFEKNERE